MATVNNPHSFSDLQPLQLTPKTRVEEPIDSLQRLATRVLLKTFVNESGYFHPNVILDLTNSLPLSKFEDPLKTLQSLVIPNTLKEITASIIKSMIWKKIPYPPHIAMSLHQNQTVKNITRGEIIKFLDQSNYCESVINSQTPTTLHRIPLSVRTQLGLMTSPHPLLNDEIPYHLQTQLLILQSFDSLASCNLVNLHQIANLYWNSHVETLQPPKFSHFETHLTIRSLNQSIHLLLDDLYTFNIPIITTSLIKLAITHTLSESLTHIIYFLARNILKLTDTSYNLLITLNKLPNYPKPQIQPLTRPSPKQAIKIKTNPTFCHWDHNLPKCRTCGWRTSWTKNFKKHNIFIIYPKKQSAAHNEIITFTNH